MGHTGQWHLRPLTLLPGSYRTWAREGRLPGTVLPRQSPGRPAGGVGPQPAIIMANGMVLPEEGAGLLKKGKEAC